MKSAAVVLLFLASFELLTGCYHYVPLQATLLDAETGAPLAGKEVHIIYGRVVEFFPPDERPVTTNAEGVATLRVAINYPVDRPTGEERALLYIDPYCLDQRELATYYTFPIPEYARAYVDAKKQHLPLQPIRLSLKVLTLKAWRNKYQYP